MHPNLTSERIISLAVKTFRLTAIISLLILTAFWILLVNMLAQSFDFGLIPISDYATTVFFALGVGFILLSQSIKDLCLNLIYIHSAEEISVSDAIQEAQARNDN